MKPNALPAIWLDLKPGDRVHSRKPYHWLQERAADAARIGLLVEFEPAPSGYWVLCVDDLCEDQ